MSEHVENAVLNALSADAVEFKNNVFLALDQKITDALMAKKLEIAQSFFGSDTDNNNSEGEETANEEF
jgi:hypothetical protein